MSDNVGTVTIHVADLQEVKAALEQASDLIAHLQAESKELRDERDEWEESYNRLLASIGGTSPGGLERATLDNSLDERRSETGVSTSGTIR